MKGWGRHGEAQRVRDPLALELVDRGWEVKREYHFSGGYRCDIWASRWPDVRLIECKIRNPLAAVPQVLGYAVRYEQECIPTIAIPRSEASPSGVEVKRSVLRDGRC